MVNFKIVQKILAENRKNIKKFVKNSIISKKKVFKYFSV